MEFWISLLIQLAIVVVVTIAATFAWAFGTRALGHLNKPFRSDEKAAAIRPWRPFWFVCGLFLALVAIIGGASGFFISDSPIGALMMLALGLFIGFLAWCSLAMCLPRAVISWTETAVEGPTSAWSLDRREMRWSDIERVRRSQEGNFFQNARGDRIVWSDMYIGSRFLWGYLIHKRPEFRDDVVVSTAANG